MNTQTPLAPALSPDLFHPDRGATRHFLPRLFSHDYVRAENCIYQYASRYLPDFDGCEWEFVPVKTSGGFMQPGEGRWRFASTDNGAVLELSAEAAGVAITALVLNHFSWMYEHNDEPDLCEHFCLRFRQLTAFAATHPEAAQIFRALN